MINVGFRGIGKCFRMYITWQQCYVVNWDRNGQIGTNSVNMFVEPYIKIFWSTCDINFSTHCCTKSTRRLFKGKTHVHTSVMNYRDCSIHQTTGRFWPMCCAWQKRIKLLVNKIHCSLFTSNSLSLPLCVLNSSYRHIDNELWISLYVSIRHTAMDIINDGWVGTRWSWKI